VVLCALAAAPPPCRAGNTSSIFSRRASGSNGSNREHPSFLDIFRCGEHRRKLCCSRVALADGQAFEPLPQDPTNTTNNTDHQHPDGRLGKKGGVFRTNASDMPTLPTMAVPADDVVDAVAVEVVAGELREGVPPASASRAQPRRSSGGGSRRGGGGGGGRHGGSRRGGGGGGGGGGPPPRARAVLGVVDHRYLPVAERIVGGMSRDEIAANYMKPAHDDQAEGKDTIQACEDTHTTLRCNAPRLTFTKLQTQALMPPDQNVAPQLAQMPTGTRGIVPGETAPERMTRDVVWKDNQQHFGQDKTAPQQLEDETPVAQFVHNSGQQFRDTMSLTIGDLENRLHMVADDFEGPLQKAKVRLPPSLHALCRPTCSAHHYSQALATAAAVICRTLPPLGSNAGRLVSTASRRQAARYLGQ
jgi:hypothetical protein